MKIDWTRAPSYVPPAEITVVLEESEARAIRHYIENIYYTSGFHNVFFNELADTLDSLDGKR